MSVANPDSVKLTGGVDNGHTVEHWQRTASEKKITDLKLHANPEGYEMHAEAVLGPATSDGHLAGVE